jgi:hypothetical protein
MDVLIARYTEKLPRRPEEQFKYLCIAMKASQRAVCKQTREVLELQFFTDHIAPLAGSFNFKLTGKVISLFQPPERQLCRPTGERNRPRPKPKVSEIRRSFVPARIKAVKSAQKTAPGTF